MNENLPILPVGYQDYPTIREDGAIYVDKTRYLYNLIKGGRVYFISRPRRFGKSLMLSTLEQVFRVKKALFNETWIASSDYDWPEHPVIRIDMANTERHTLALFKKTLMRQLLVIADDYDIALTEDETGPATMLTQLIDKMNAKYSKVVVLIDEYDKPILDNISDEELAKHMRSYLRDFYTVLKSQDGKIRFIMLTGITKFSKISIFSGLNNLQDLTMVNDYASMLGYTQSELESSFEPWIKLLAKKNNATVQNELLKIKKWYNGYCFAQNGEGVYNPFSTLLLFAQLTYDIHWYATGTPTFLIDLIEDQCFDPQEIGSLEVSKESLQIPDVTQMSLIPLLYQTGYLTIKSYDPEFDLFCLDYPNFEVRRTFTAALLTSIAELSAVDQSSLLAQMLRSVQANDWERLFTVIKTFMAAIPYQLHQPTEKYYHTIFYLLFRTMGYRLNAEVTTNIGRIDAILELKDKILIFELKLNQTAEAALAQIHEKQYYAPFQNQGKVIHLFGVNFDIEKRNVTSWLHEQK